MKYRILLSDEKYKTRKIVDILSFLLPFSLLTGRERDVLAEYIDGYFEFKKKGLTDAETYLLLFDYDFTNSVSNKISTKDKPVTIESVRNYVTKLRKIGLLKDRSINEDYIKLFSSIKDNITLVFEIKK